MDLREVSVNLTTKSTPNIPLMTRSIPKHRLYFMLRWVKFAFITSGLILIAVSSLVTIVYFYQYSSVIETSTQRIIEWKKLDWKDSTNFDVLRKALIAAEDTTFLTHPKLECGVGSLIKDLTKHVVSSMCSPIISHAARLATSEIYVKPSYRKFAELSMEQSLSTQPSESIDIIFNKTYMGMAKDGKTIEGFQSAARYYYGKSLDEIKVSEAALLAGMIQSPQRFAPDKNPDLAKQRRDLIIDRMLEVDFISENDALVAKKDVLQ